MSAISGLVRFDEGPIEPGLVERMTAAMAHRGPDGLAHWRSGSVGLGFCALHSTPESLLERQPLDDGDRILVLDGRVDNREELKAALLGRGMVLRNDSDAELVLRAYETFGEQCPDRIVGEFVFVVWDARGRSLFGARDPAGRRHFYYHVGNRWAAFASEIKGLHALGSIETRLNEARLVDSLVNAFDRIDQVGTFFAGIDRLPAGHAMRISAGGVTTWRYWDPSNLPESRFRSLEECAEAFRERLREAIECRLRSTGPVGAMLSGGLDSSSIVGIVRKDFATKLRQPLKTFSLVREDRENCPEFRSASRVVQDGGLEPHFLLPSAASEVWRRYVDAIPELDEPFWLNYGYTNQLVCEAARREGCRVLLDGVDGDILFYWIDDSIVLRGHALRFLPGVFAAARRHGEGHPWRALGARLAAALLPERLRSLYRRNAYRGSMASDARLLRPGIIEPLFRARWIDRPYSRPASEQEFHGRILTSGQQAYAHETYGQIAFAQSIDPRSPLSDRRVLEFAVRMPFGAKACAGWYKRILRLGAAQYLPDPVRWRRDVTMHPGGEFRARFVAEVARGAPDIWSRQLVERKMDKWVDADRLRQEWREYERTGRVDQGLNLLVLVTAARWLDARFP